VVEAVPSPQPVPLVTLQNSHLILISACWLQVATVLLARLLSWLHLTHVVCPGSPDCLRFVLVMGERQAGKASLFSRLVAAPSEYAAQLGGGAEEGLDGTTDMGAQVVVVVRMWKMLWQGQWVTDSVSQGLHALHGGLRHGVCHKQEWHARV